MNMYFIAIVLPLNLNERIRKYKEWMQERFGCKVGLKSPAHITLIAPFWMEATWEMKLINTVDDVCKKQFSIPIQTQNFGAFKPRTLFVSVAPSIQLNDLKKEIEKGMWPVPEFSFKKENRPFHPHITIATRDVHKAVFYEALAHFNQKKFEEEWEADGVSILKHNSRTWNVLHTAPLKKEGHA